MSTDWYVRQEKGHIDAVAQALRLDDAERLHLFARTVNRDAPHADAARNR